LQIECRQPLAVVGPLAYGRSKTQKKQFHKIIGASETMGVGITQLENRLCLELSASRSCVLWVSDSGKMDFFIRCGMRALERSEAVCELRCLMLRYGHNLGLTSF